MSRLMNQERYNELLDDRARTVMHAIVDAGRMNLWNAHAFLALEACNFEELAETVQTFLGVATFAASESAAAGPFHVLPAALLYCRWHETLPNDVNSSIRSFFTRATIDRGNTENHWLMHYTGNLLMAERLENETLMWNGLSPKAVRAEATRWISGMIDRSALYGHHEYDSTGYIAEHVTPLIGIVEYTRDVRLREKAAKMLALHFTDLAVEYFYGAWAGGHSREGYRVNTWTQSGTVRGIHYHYFGNEDFDPQRHAQAYIAPNLVASYRPPELIISMAFERNTPFVVRKTKAPRTIYRHAERPSGPVRKYTYMSRSFSLGSTQVNLPGAPAGPIDLTSWDLTWDGPKHQAKVVCNHPYRDPRRFSAFLPVLPQVAGREIGSGKPYLQWPDRLFGASPYERIMQHRETAIVLYRIDENDRNPYVNLYLPKGLVWTERNGWLFAEVTNHERADTTCFFLALYPIGLYRWHEIKEAASSNIMVREGDLIDGWLLRIEDRYAGLVVEAVEKSRNSDYESFILERSETIPDTRLWPSRKAVEYETTSGDRLKMEYGGLHTVNGEAIDYDRWPLYDAPWVHAETGTGIVRYEKDGEKIEYDFEASHPLIPMRVIG